MNLVEKIEVEYNKSWEITMRQYWPQIKAALEAAQDMADCLDIYGTLAGGHVTKAELALRKFREEMK